MNIFFVFVIDVILTDVVSASPPQTPGTLTNRNSKQLINTTASNGNAVSQQSTPTESKKEVNYSCRSSFQ